MEFRQLIQKDMLKGMKIKLVEVLKHDVFGTPKIKIFKG